MKYILFALFVSFWVPASAQTSPFFDSTGIVASEFEGLMKIKQVFSFTEGPVADKDGKVYFTDQPNNRIWRYDPATTVLWEFKKDAGRANGLDIDAKGNIIACADENNEIWSIDTRGHIVKVLLGKVDGKKLNGPNDLWIDRKGGIYFTDPYYQRDYWTRTAPEIKEQNVYYLPKGATQPITVNNELVKPNGITGSADGKYLFVADIGDNKTYRFQINRDGTLSGKQLFVSQGSDGITLDNRGNLYLTGNGVTVYDSTGKKIAYIPVPEKWTANICFGGKDRNILFMTAGPSVYYLKMKAKGPEKFKRNQ
ncbi:SMP-30/gluconolactonase/LRE family protein [Niabella yanshanensis]|uniref:SMP-30/gluconolactonase/LRE family protein n=1 Tax=Niabella yanshanensis TaxID=577386 RepID=A0ABZ0WB67_9BACT|nr:SMP-30/gluconolactonase/LRE family protein [Niabella yanshanensis]WQD40431.1 SMP-30/gluconolactonase/LRE family protein [Niabella yanshanensis]